MNEKKKEEEEKYLVNVARSLDGRSGFLSKSSWFDAVFRSLISRPRDLYGWLSGNDFALFLQAVTYW